MLDLARFRRRCVAMPMDGIQRPREPGWSAVDRTTFDEDPGATTSHELAVADHWPAPNEDAAHRPCDLEAWLRGLGAVAIDNLMEDAATAEISRSQVWHWIHQDRTTEDGTPITRGYVEGLISEVLGEVDRGPGDRFDDAADVFRDVALRDEFPTFLTLGAYSRFLVDTK